MSNKVALLFKALTKALAGFVLVAILLFVPAGTLDYVYGIRFMLILFVPMLIMGIVMWFKSPALLSRRLESKEKRQAQQGVIKYSGLLFIVGFVVAGLDFRWEWSSLPHWLTQCSSVLFVAGYLLYFEVMRENVWLSRTIRVENEQEVITTGVYGIVRHPMYTATLFMFLSIPFVLGSWWAVPIFMLYIPIIVCRILDEEKLLKTELKGYADYCMKLRWRLIPFVW